MERITSERQLFEHIEGAFPEFLAYDQYEPDLKDAGPFLPLFQNMVHEWCEKDARENIDRFFSFLNDFFMSNPDPEIARYVSAELLEPGIYGSDREKALYPSRLTGAALEEFRNMQANLP